MSVPGPADPAAEKVSVKIDGQELAYWHEIEVELALDSLANVTLRAPFDSSRKELRDLLRPFRFKPLSVFLNGARLFTGTVVGVNPQITPESRTVEVTGYALAGVLNDCTAPGKAFPVEFKKLRYGAIASKICEPFEIVAQVRDDAGAPFKRVRLEEDRKLLDFLGDLARQRNLVLSNTTDGNLLAWRSVAPGNPVAKLRAGEPPLPSVSAQFSPQEYYSEVTCFSKTTRRRRGSQYTQKNRFLTSVLRPLAFKLEDTDPQEAPDATRAKLGRMFANLASYDVEDLPTWRDPQGDLWYPNTTVTLEAIPDLMLYRRTELLVRRVNLKQTKEKTSASLNLVLPGAFSGEVPDQLPWEE